MVKLEISEIGNFLKPDLVADGDVVRIMSEGKTRDLQTQDGKSKVVFDIEVLHKGDTYTWTMNKTTLKALAGKLGVDTAKWKDKAVKIRKVKMNVRGIIKDVLLGEAVEVSNPGIEVIKV